MPSRSYILVDIFQPPTPRQDNIKPSSPGHSQASIDASGPIPLYRDPGCSERPLGTENITRILSSMCQYALQQEEDDYSYKNLIIINLLQMRKSII